MFTGSRHTGQMDGWEGDEYVEEREEDLGTHEDEELDEIMEFVFGEEDISGY